LYLFAGPRRKSDVREYLLKLASKFKAKAIVKEIDVLRDGRKHDLLSKARRGHFLTKIRRGDFDLVLASPPCSSFSRARWASKAGPRPVRSKAFPRGFPWLKQAKQSTIDANKLVDFATAALDAQFGNGGMGLLEHPEDLGVTAAGEMPGAIWDWPEVRSLTKHPDVHTGALYQCSWGRPFAKPTRLLLKAGKLKEILELGWPTFNADGKYEGPLGPKPETTESLTGKSGRDFATARSAAWPPELCHRIATTPSRNS